MDWALDFGELLVKFFQVQRELLAVPFKFYESFPELYGVSRGLFSFSLKIRSARWNSTAPLAERAEETFRGGEHRFRLRAVRRVAGSPAGPAPPPGRRPAGPPPRPASAPPSSPRRKPPHPESPSTPGRTSTTPTSHLTLPEG